MLNLKMENAEIIYTYFGFGMDNLGEVLWLHPDSMNVVLAKADVFASWSMISGKFLDGVFKSTCTFHVQV